MGSTDSTPTLMEAKPQKAVMSADITGFKGARWRAMQVLVASIPIQK